MESGCPGMDSHLSHRHHPVGIVRRPVRQDNTAPVTHIGKYIDRCAVYGLRADAVAAPHTRRLAEVLTISTSTNYDNETSISRVNISLYAYPYIFTGVLKPRPTI